MVKFIIEVSDEWFNKNATVKSALESADKVSFEEALANTISKADIEHKYKEGTREFVVSNDACPEALSDAFISLCDTYMAICAASND